MLADASGQEDLSSSMAVGTPKYMSPEQITGEAVSTSTDIYAMGLIAWEMVMGKPAFHGRTPLEIVAKQLNEAVPELPAGVAATPIGRVITRAISKRAEDRFANASQALAELSPAPTNVDTAWLDDDLLGGAGGNNFLPAHLWGDGGSAPGAEGEESFLKEGTLGGDDDGPLAAGATIVSNFEDNPTQAIMMLSDADLELEEEEDEGEFESGPTTLWRGLSPEPPQEQRPRHSEVVDTNHTGEEGTDPNSLDTSRPDRAPSNVLLSPEPDLPEPREARSRSVPPRGPARIERMSEASFPAEQTTLGARLNVSEKGVDRSVVLALSLLGVGLVAILTLVIVALSVPIVRDAPGSVVDMGAAQPEPSAVNAPPDVAVAAVAVDLATPGQPVADINVSDPSSVADISIADAPPDIPALPPRWIIEITTDPPGAQLIIDDEVLGETPTFVERTTQTGTVKGLFRLAGFQDKEFEYQYDGPTKLSFTLTRRVAPATKKAPGANGAQRKGPPRRTTKGARTPKTGRNGKSGAKGKAKSPPMGKEKKKGANPWGKW
jgi:hypothetical protein